MLVAVYGSLKQGHGNHCILDGARYIGTDTIYGEWVMWDFGCYPGVSKAEGGTPDHILVEVYEVDDSQLIDLDNLEGYRGKGEDNYYTRESIDTQYGTAWWYTLPFREYCSYPVVVGGCW